MKLTLALAALFILIIGGGYLWKVVIVPATTNQKNIPVTATYTPPTQAIRANSGTKVTTTSSTTSSTYTAAQVATHTSDSSCWTIINGNVYNLTSWISQHPGGPEHIEAICGIDGTSAFEGQHGNEARPNAILATFKIGTLSK